MLIPHIIVGACLAMSVSACSDDDDTNVNDIIDRPTKTTLNLNRYYDESGAIKQFKWTDEDMAILTVPSTGYKAQASPIQPGLSSSLFLFTVKAPAQATVVSYYPTDAPVTVGSGKVNLEIPAIQDGKISPLLLGHDCKVLSSYEGCTIDLKHFPATLMVNIARGNHYIKSVEVRANGGENIAGKITIDADTWSINASEATARVDLPSPLDCTLNPGTVAVQLAPIYLSQGYSVTVTDTNGHTIGTSTDAPLELTSATVFTTDNAADNEPMRIIACGTNKVHVIDAGAAIGGAYTNGLLWTWDAKTAASDIGLAESRCDHIDDCKPVDGGSKFLITSSYNWCVLLDRETKKVLFSANQCSNAHSAELLPGNRIAVACSEGTSTTHNQVQIYDISKPNSILFSTPLTSGHGVVWSDDTQRLYAMGGQSLNVYSLVDWDTASPKLKLEKSITTPQSGTHDLTMADATTLVVAGKKAYLFDIYSEKFTEMTHFSACTALKSVNYNPLTSELWYTDATVPEGTQSWSTHTLRYATDIAASSMAGSISITDMDVYKVRVLNW